MKAKYLKNHTISNVNRTLDDSPVWYDLLKVKHIYLRGREIKVKNGRDCAFWMDNWLDKKALYEISPALFTLCKNRNYTTNKDQPLGTIQQVELGGDTNL